MNTIQCSRGTKSSCRLRGLALWLGAALMSSAAGNAAVAAPPALGFPLDPGVLAAPGKPAPSIALGASAGTLVVDGKTIPLKYAYATQQVLPQLEAPEWSLEQRTSVNIVFSDVELPVELRTNSDALPLASLAGKFHGAAFLLHPRLADGRSVKLFYPLTPQSAALGVTATNMKQDGDGDLVLSSLRLDGSSLSGVLEMTRPFNVSSNFVVQPGMPASMQLTRTTFNAKLERLPAPVEIDGPATIETAPFEAFVRFNEVGLKGDIANLRKLLTDDLDRMMGPVLEQAPPEELKEAFMSGDVLRKAIVGSATVGDRAILAFRIALMRPESAAEAKDRTQEVKLTKVDGQWRISEL